MRNIVRPGRLCPALALSVCALALIAGSTVVAQGDADTDAALDCGSHVVASGDTLGKLANRAYGDPSFFVVIFEANYDLLNGNPDNLAIGSTLDLPCLDDGTPAETLEEVVAVEGPLSPEELDLLFGPIALFPDDVLTIVLVAATVPLDVVKAERFLEAFEPATETDTPSDAASDETTSATDATPVANPDAAFARAIAEEPWDDSVRQLAAAFPDLLRRMSDHIDWTEQAGDAVVAQTDDVLDAIQRLRQTARDNGYLEDNDAQTVEEDGGAISIQPATPGVVYVPTYQPDVVYTTPIYNPPSYYYGDYHDDDWEHWLITGGIILGGAIILDEIFDDDDWDGWGDWDHADIDWDGGDIIIDRGDRIDIGGGDRIDIGDGDRISIADRPRVDHRDDGASIGQRDRPPATASRDAARQKIEARKAANRGTATLPAQRPAAPRVNRPEAPRQRAEPAARPNVAQRPSVSRPSGGSAFQRPGGSARPSAAANRGRSSYGGGRPGGGARGGGGRR